MAVPDFYQNIVLVYPQPGWRGDMVGFEGVLEGVKAKNISEPGTVWN